MEKIVDDFIDELDIEKLYYKTLGHYQNLLRQTETVSELEKELPEGSQMSDIDIKYDETMIRIKKEFTRLIINCHLSLNSIRIGSYKVEYSINGDFLDEYLVFD